MTTLPPRDRDRAGRARNARPRDSLGRPLKRDEAGQPVPAAGPRLAPEQARALKRALAPEQALAPGEALRLAQSLLDSGHPFHAHEVLEEAWKAAPPGERDLWRGLAQLAVGLTHARRGNAAGAIALLRRGAAGVSGHQGPAPHGIDVAAAGDQAGQLASRIEQDGLTAIWPAEYTIRLSTQLPALLAGADRGGPGGVLAADQVA